MGRKPVDPEMRCDLIDHTELVTIDRRIQVECTTCRKWFLEGDLYPCLLLPSQTSDIPWNNTKKTTTIPTVEPISNGNSRRQEIIQEVSNCVLKDRQNNYGDAEDNFTDIAFRWSNYLSRRLSRSICILPQDVAIMMADLKITRAAANPDHLDNLIDGAGYFVCAGGIAKKRNETND